MANGVFPVDYSTEVGKVRGLIPDVTTEDGTLGTDFLFSDEHLEALLSIYGDSVFLASAAAIDTLANDEALLYKVVKTDDLSVDGTRVADSLRKRAASLRADAARIDDESFVMTYPVNDVFLPEATPPIWGRTWSVGQWR